MARETRYWDATVFRAWFSGESEAKASCGPIIKRADAHEIHIYTSALTLVECIDDRFLNLGPEAQLDVHDLLRRSCFNIVQLDRFVAELARDIMADHRIDVHQAIHLAAALRARTPIFETFQSRLLNLSGRVPIQPHGALAITLPGATDAVQYELDAPAAAVEEAAMTDPAPTDPPSPP